MTCHYLQKLKSALASFLISASVPSPQPPRVFNIELTKASVATSLLNGAQTNLHVRVRYKTNLIEFYKTVIDHARILSPLAAL